MPNLCVLTLAGVHREIVPWLMLRLIVTLLCPRGTLVCLMYCSFWRCRCSCTEKKIPSLSDPESESDSAKGLVSGQIKSDSISLPMCIPDLHMLKVVVPRFKSDSMSCTGTWDGREDSHSIKSVVILGKLNLMSWVGVGHWLECTYCKVARKSAWKEQTELLLAEPNLRVSCSVWKQIRWSH